MLVVGLLAGRDPAEMLTAFDAADARLVGPPPALARDLPPPAGADVAGALGTVAEETTSAPEAVATALALAQPDDIVVVTGSLYVVGAARARSAHRPACSDDGDAEPRPARTARPSQ